MFYFNYTIEYAIFYKERYNSFVLINLLIINYNDKYVDDKKCLK